MPTASDAIRQAGVLPVKDGKICLVTARSGRRWIIPKGLIDPGQTAGEAALVEAWEEAGLVGVLQPEPLGSFVYEKFGKIYHVVVFTMQVGTAHEQWPEQSQRERVWLDPADAIERLGELDLANLVRAWLSREDLIAVH